MIDPVTIAERKHLYPSRTQKLSSLAPMILGGKLPGKVGSCRFIATGLFYKPAFGPMVKRLRHRPFTAVTRVRFPVGSPDDFREESMIPFFTIITINICAIGGIGRRTRFRF